MDVAMAPADCEALAASDWYCGVCCRGPAVSAALANGRPVRVYCPAARAFRAGIVEAFEPLSGKHRVAYHQSTDPLAPQQREEEQEEEGDDGVDGHNEDWEYVCLASNHVIYTPPTIADAFFEPPVLPSATQEGADAAASDQPS